MIYFIRKNCIFCDNILIDPYFINDKTIPLCSYTTAIYENIFIPYNIYKCYKCNTIQTKYLGNLDLVYKINHADSTGNIMKNLHYCTFNILNKYKNNIKNIVEIGSSIGILSDIIINNITHINKYYIIEPNYIGKNNDKKIIIADFFENVNNNKYNDANILIISHVFEHFYNPTDILIKIQDNINIEYFVLVWPDLEYYKNNNIYHVLNTEHTFYVDNNFIILLLNNYKFELIEKYSYENHSVIFIFKRNITLLKQLLINNDVNIDNYYSYLQSNGKKISDFIIKNTDKKICLWPCSVHSQFLLTFNNDLHIDYILDNSPNKIGKYLFGYNILCKSFNDCINDDNCAVILNGGIFNKEIKNYTNKNVLIL